MTEQVWKVLLLLLLVVAAGDPQTHPHFPPLLLLLPPSPLPLPSSWGRWKHLIQARLLLLVQTSLAAADHHQDQGALPLVTSSPLA
jgi:hypothetical protein